MMNNDDLPAAGTDPFAPPPIQNSPRSGSCLNWGLILTGGLIALFGCLMLFAGASVQMEQQGDWEGFYAFLLLCPFPMIIFGVVILVVGALPFVRKRQIEDTDLN